MNNKIIIGINKKLTPNAPQDALGVRLRSEKMPHGSTRVDAY